MKKCIKISVFLKETMPVNVFADQTKMIESILPEIMRLIMEAEIAALTAND